ncbi:MAG: Maf family nucleotide pyrophosphatase [Bacteroidota bacterium]|nr:Maf family nucleotide pyrophosphatase [Bacteroidota bacterium]
MDIQTLIPNFNIILASHSPRRQQLLKNMGWKFTVKTHDIPEFYPDDLKMEQIPVYLSKLKANSFKSASIPDNTIIITADTVVFLKDNVLNKPKDNEEAIKMLKQLSGKKHEVITAVTLKSNVKMVTFHVTTDVYFKELSDEEILFYVNNYNPLDKAGAYGIQDWIGYIGIEQIDGSFFNVMGLPLKELYEEVMMF